MLALKLINLVYLVPQIEQVNKLAADEDVSATAVDDDIIKVPNSAPSAGGLGDGVGSDGEEAGMDMLGDGMGWARCGISSPMLTGEFASEEQIYFL